MLKVEEKNFDEPEEHEYPSSNVKAEPVHFPYKFYGYAEPNQV